MITDRALFGCGKYHVNKNKIKFGCSNYYAKGCKVGKGYLSCMVRLIQPGRLHRFSRNTSVPLLYPKSAQNYQKKSIFGGVTPQPNRETDPACDVTFWCETTKRDVTCFSKSSVDSTLLDLEMGNHSGGNDR
jgi:hypothetical protein